jgi:hypothetical protein
VIATDRRTVYIENVVKHRVREDDGGRRDPAHRSNTDKQLFDLSKAESKILKGLPFNSTKFIAAQLQTSHELAKRTLIEVLGMKKFSW